jgi:monovalent cation:H+ antiporter-2, CPA2 family
MPHETTLIAAVVMGLVLAFCGGLLASSSRLPPLIGYLLAGVAVGPSRPVSWPAWDSPASSPRSASSC